MMNCPSCGAALNKLNEGNTNVGKAKPPKVPYKGAGNKLKNAVGARPNPTNAKTWRTTGRKIMD